MALGATALGEVKQTYSRAFRFQDRQPFECICAAVRGLCAVR
jgi:hypothetical protein